MKSESTATIWEPPKTMELPVQTSGVPIAASVRRRAKRVGCRSGITVRAIVAPNHTLGK
jgi:hypothetical protein